MRRIWTRRGRLYVLAAAVVLGAGVLQGSSLTVPAHAASCTTSWASPVNGLWGDAGNWTNGVPDFSSVACITLDGTYTVVSNQGGTRQLVLGGTSGTQTLAVTAGARPCSACGASTDARFSLDPGDSLVGQHGVVELTGLANPPSPASAGGVSQLTFNGTVLTLQGTFISDPTGLEGGDSGGLRGFGNGGTFVNEGTVEIDANTGYFSGAQTFSNQSVLDIAAGKTFATTQSNGNSFVNDAGGSIVNNGAFIQQGLGGFTEGDGTTSGNPVLVDSALTFTGNGASTFDMVGGSISGNMAAGQNLTIEAGTPYGHDVDIGYQAPATVAGTITVTSAGGGGNALLDVGPISPANALTITGSLTVDPSGGGTRQLRGYVVNDGTVAINADTAFFGGGSTFANHGSFAIADGKTFAVNATFTNGADGTFASTIDANTNTFGQLNGGGIVNLDGKLKVMTVGSPAVGSTWPIISGVGRSGTFASDDFGGINYAVLYPPDGVTLVVQAPVSHTLTVTKAGSGSGTVTSSPAGVDCGSTCSATFTQGTIVTLTATPDANSTFTGWSGACSGSGTCTVTIDQDRAVTATFELVRHTLTVSKAGSGAGTVTSSPAGVDCGSTCSATFTQGTIVTLTATPGANSTFAGWSGACSGSGACTVTLNQDGAVTATFHEVLRPVACVVPNVKRKPLATAERLIVAARCRVGRVKKARSKTKKGLVIAQSPPAHRSLPVGSRVNLVVSRGKR